MLANQVADVDGNFVAASALGTFSVNVGSGGPNAGDLDELGDIDGDNFTNGWEQALGSDPFNPAARPFNLPVPATGGKIRSPRLFIDLDFASTPNDLIRVSGRLPAKDKSFSTAGQIVILDVGGNVRAFTMDADGNGVVTTQRLYQLVRAGGSVADHTFEIRFLDPGVQAYAFTFG